MNENKENGDAITWDDVEQRFSSLVDFWVYIFDKRFLSLERIEEIQNELSACFEIVRLPKEQRDYYDMAQRIGLLEIYFFSSTSQEIIRRRALQEINLYNTK